MAKKPFFFLIFFIAVAFLLPETVLATDFTSTNFKVKDPVISMGGATSTSSGFKLDSSIGQLGIATSTSSSFQLKGGWLYFSEVAAPAPTPAVVAAAGGNYSMYLESLVKLGILPLLPTEVKPCDIAFDLNCDGNVGLKDFSIFLAVQNRPAPNPADFNKDNKIDFKDLSILLSSWTGKLLSFSEPTTGALLTGAARALPFRGEAAISVLKPASEPPLVTLLPQKPAIEKLGFLKTAVQFISNVFNRVIELFTK